MKLCWRLHKSNWKCRDTLTATTKYDWENINQLDLCIKKTFSFIFWEQPCTRIVSSRYTSILKNYLSNCNLDNKKYQLKYNFDFYNFIPRILELFTYCLELWEITLFHRKSFVGRCPLSCPYKARLHCENLSS